MSARPTMIRRVEEYLAHRRRLGYVLHGVDQQLRQFARYADRTRHRGPVTVELAVRWARLPQRAKPQWWARRLSIVRGFAKHRSLFEPGTQIPQQGLLGLAVHSRVAPHIYAPPEITALLRAAMDLGPADGLRPHTYVALFGLLASSGLRISEALHLSRDDVDLDAGVLTVVQTKFRKSRLVPLHPSATRALLRYVERRDEYHPAVTANEFFLNEHGTRVGYSGVRNAFDALRRQLGWTRGPSGRRPRIHDLRHTMCVERMLRWYKEGADIDCKIATLATYLGHVEVTDTYWYLTGVPELMALAATRFESFGRKGMR